MYWNLEIKINEKLFLRDPNSTELGRKIVKHGIIMIEEIGLEDFTFKKLALSMETTEASIYRYFENKQLFLIYVVSWYWNWLEYLIIYKTNNLTDPIQKMDIVLDILLLNTQDYIDGGPEVDKRILHLLVIKESSKSYLTHQVQKYNEAQFFKPYKSLCNRIATILLEINPDYTYSKNLTSTLLLMARNLYFFMHNLPSLTDFSEQKEINNTKNFLMELVKSSVKNK
jgi:AcrR family transcriptional regulator